MTQRQAARLRKIGTGPLSDAIGKAGGMDHDMHCRSGSAPMAGPAFTLRVHTAGGLRRVTSADVSVRPC